MKFDHPVNVITPALEVPERGVNPLGDNNFSRVSADQLLITETSKNLQSLLQSGFPTHPLGLQELHETLGVRALYLDSNSQISTAERSQLTFGKVSDQFLDKLTQKLEQGTLSEQDLRKLHLLNLQLQSGDSLAVDFIMKDFDRRTIGQLDAVVRNHQRFTELWKPEPSTLSIDDQFQLVNARGVLTKTLEESGIVAPEINRRIALIYDTANELASFGISVSQIVGLLNSDHKNVIKSDFSLEEKYKFLESLDYLCHQNPAPLGIGPYLGAIFHSKIDVSGNMQEAIVAASLMKHGWVIHELSHEVYSPRTELDLIASHAGEKFVIEVKTSTSTFIRKNDRATDNQITNLLHHCEYQHAKLGIVCLDQARVHTDGVIKAVTGALQHPEDIYKVFVITNDGFVYDLQGNKAA